MALVERPWRVGPDPRVPLTAAARSGSGSELPSAFGVGAVYLAERVAQERRLRKQQA